MLKGNIPNIKAALTSSNLVALRIDQVTYFWHSTIRYSLLAWSMEHGRTERCSAGSVALVAELVGFEGIG